MMDEDDVREIEAFDDTLELIGYAVICFVGIVATLILSWFFL